MNQFNIKKFRSVRQLLSSIVCIVLAVVVVLNGYSEGHWLMKLLLMVLGTGMFYCMFGFANLLVGIVPNGFIKNRKVLNCVVDTLIYLALFVGGFFLVTFICNKIIWIGIIFALGGFFEVYRNIQYLSELSEGQSAATV